MKFNRRFILPVLMAAACLAVIPACKKDDDEEETKPSFSGLLSFSIPEYTYAGQELTVTPSGAYRSDGGTYGYYWYSSTNSTVRDTTRYESDPETVLGTFIFTVPDTLATISLNVAIYGEGYYTTTATRNTTVVKPGHSVSMPTPSAAQTFKDSRDGKYILYVHLGDLDWMIRNLQYAPGGAGYADCDIMKDVTGTFYTWENAVNACPEGWRLPTVAEYAALCGGSFVGAAGHLMDDKAYFHEERMWEYWPEVSADNATLFSAISAGYGNFDGESWTFDGLMSYAAFWTSDTADEERAAYILLNAESPDVAVGYGHKEYFGANVRCVR
ncbi:MAG: FISUMP domain-containing protein [Candidatus Cryptobacteroides sp.]